VFENKALEKIHEPKKNEVIRTVKNYIICIPCLILSGELNQER
jgi:hypothetical protein